MNSKFRGMAAGIALAAGLLAAPASAQTVINLNGIDGISNAQARQGYKVAAASTYGIIRFGSRVDLYLPPGSTVLVGKGQRTIGGETVIAELPALPKG